MKATLHTFQAAAEVGHCMLNAYSLLPHNRAHTRTLIALCARLPTQSTLAQLPEWAVAGCFMPPGRVLYLEDAKVVLEDVVQHG